MSVKIYHVPRDYSKPLQEQKKELKEKYKEGWRYLWTDNAGGDAKIHFMAEEVEDERQD